VACRSLLATFDMSGSISATVLPLSRRLALFHVSSQGRTTNSPSFAVHAPCSRLGCEPLPSGLVLGVSHLHRHGLLVFSRSLREFRRRSRSHDHIAEFPVLTLTVRSLMENGDRKQWWAPIRLQVRGYNTDQLIYSVVEHRSYFPSLDGEAQ
jgi:hypothetical protein